MINQTREYVQAVLDGVERGVFSASMGMKYLYLDGKYVGQPSASPQAKCVGRDGNVEPEIAAKLFGAEPAVGNEPMKETHFKDYKPE